MTQRSGRQAARLERERRRIQRLIANGMCVRCGRPARPGRRMCGECARREAARKNAEHYARRSGVAA